MERLEAERRAMWHELCGKDMSKTIEKFDLRKDKIEEWKQIYREVLL